MTRSQETPQPQQESRHGTRVQGVLEQGDDFGGHSCWCYTTQDLATPLPRPEKGIGETSTSAVFFFIFIFFLSIGGTVHPPMYRASSETIVAFSGRSLLP